MHVWKIRDMRRGACSMAKSTAAATSSNNEGNEMFEIKPENV